LAPAAAAALPPFPSGFIRAHGTRFVDSECRVFNPVGWNRRVASFEKDYGGVSMYLSLQINNTN